MKDSNGNAEKLTKSYKIKWYVVNQSIGNTFLFQMIPKHKKKICNNFFSYKIVSNFRNLILLINLTSLFKEFDIFLKMKCYNQAWKNTQKHYSKQLISHLEGHFVFLWDEFKEKDQLINSLLEKLSKCNDTIKISRVLSIINTE